LTCIELQLGGIDPAIITCGDGANIKDEKTMRGPSPSPIPESL